MSRPRFPCSLHRRLQHSHCTDLGCPASLNCYLMKEMSCWVILDGRLCQKLHLHGYIMFIPFFDSIPYWIFVSVPTFTYCFFHHLDRNFTRLLSSFKNILVCLIGFLLKLFNYEYYMFIVLQWWLFLCVWLTVELFPQTFEQLLVSWHNIVLGVYFAPGPMCDNSWNADASGWTLTHRDCVD